MSEFSKDERWRADVLSSSLPLEYQVASVFVKCGFSVDADYTYTLPDSGKEYSVDIAAFDLVFKTDHQYSDVGGSLRVLAECKYRRPGTVWLFIPDPNEETWAQHRPGATLRIVDQFSPIVVPARATKQFDEGLRTALKGVEVRLLSRDSSRVDDQELRHGLDQLQFAIAPILAEQIRENLDEATNSHEMHTVFPLFMLPLIVTTAEIRVAHQDFSGASIEQSSDLNAWSDSVSSVVLTRSVGPVAKQHLRTVLDDLDLSGFAAGIRTLRDMRSARVGKRVNPLPSQALSEIRSYASVDFLPLLRQFLVCRSDSLASILGKARLVIQGALDKSFDTRIDQNELAP